MNPKQAFNQSKVNQYAAYLKSQGLSDASISRKLSSISIFQKYLIKKGLLPSSDSQSNPVRVDQCVYSEAHVPNSSSPKSFLRYLIIALFFILFSGLGYGVYTQFFSQSSKNLAYTTATNPIRANRTLSFQGRLTDSAGNPITSETPIVFKLFTAGTGGTELYTSGTGNSQTVNPDQNGIFSVVIGRTHGIEIPNSVYTENSEVWLDITAGNEHMDPRQQIATVGYAMNSETLQGLPPSASGLRDTVLIIDSQGNINLGETSPTIVSNSGTFGLVGQAVLIKAADGSGGNIEINPDSNGIIKLTTEGSSPGVGGGFVDLTNANLTSGNLINASIRNDNRDYNFLNLSNYDPSTTNLTSRFSVDAYGNTRIGATLTATNISIGNTLINSTASEINLLSGLLPTNGSIISANGSNLTNINIGTSNYVLTSNGTAPVWTSLPAATSYTASNGLTLSSSDFQLGGSLTKNTTIGTSSFSLSFLGLGNTQSLFIDPSGSVSIGNTSPAAKLHVTGTAYITGAIYTNSGVLNGVGGTTPRIYFNPSNLDFRSSDTNTAMFINSSGLIGIGTTNPTYLLDVNNGDISLKGAASTGVGSSFTDGQALRFFSSTYTGSNFYQNIYIKNTRNGINVGDQRLAFFNNAGTELMAITNSGNLGIGTTNPLGKLHIVGDEVRIGTSGTITYATADGELYVQGDLEVDGVSYFGNGIEMVGNTIAANTISGAFLHGGENEAKFSFYGSAENRLIRADEKWTTTITPSCDSGTVSSLFDGNGSYSCNYTSWVDGSSTAVANITFSNTSPLHYWTAFRLNFPFASYTTGVKVEKYYDTNSGNGWSCNDGDQVWSTIYDNSAQNQSYVDINNMGAGGGNGICQFRVTLYGNKPVGGTVRFGEVMGYQYYNGLSGGGYVSTVGGDTIYGNLQIGTSATARNLTTYGYLYTGGTTYYAGNYNGDSKLRYLGLGGASPTSSYAINATGSINLTGTIFSAGTSGSAGQILSSTGSGLAWINATVGTTYAASNGLSMVGTNIIGLGGTLTQNTTIGTSSFSLSFLGLGNTQALFISSAGNIGLGTTNPSTKLEINGTFSVRNSLNISSSGTATTIGTTTPWETFRYTNSQNIIANGNFESWSAGTTAPPDGFKNWVGAASFSQDTTPANVISGSSSVKIVSNNTTFSGLFFGGADTVVKSVGDSSTSTYTLSFWYKAASTNTNNSDIGVYDTKTGTYVFSAALTKDDTWRWFSRSFSIRNDSQWYIRWAVATSTPTTGDTVWIDQVSLTEGPVQWSQAEAPVLRTGNQTRWGNLYNLGSLGIGTTNPNALIQIVGTHQAIDSNGMLNVTSNSAYGQDIGGQITLGGTYSSAGSFARFGGLSARKENVTDGNAAGYLSFATSNSAGGSLTEKMRLSSTGNLGIGTTDPQYKLDVSANAGSGAYAAQILNTNTGGGNGLFINTADGNAGAYYALRIDTANNTRLVLLNQNGYVGLGTTAPTDRLTVSGNISASGYLYATGAVYGNYSYLTAYRPRNSTDPLRFQNFDGTNLMTILDNGFVGIGTTNPTGQLEISDASTPSLYLNYQSDTTGNTGLVWRSASDSHTASINRRLEDGSINIYTNTSSSIPKFTILDGGNVGIGTTNPLYRLEINGDSLISSRLGLGATNVGSTLAVTGNAYISNGIGVTGTSSFTNNVAIGGTLTLSVGASSGYVLTSDATGNSYWAQNIGISYAVGNGITTVATNTFGLGGQLTRNTQIGTSSFSISFLGLGSTLGLSQTSTGRVGIGTSSPIAKLDVVGDINSTTGYYLGGTSSPENIEVVRTVPASINDFVEIGNFNLDAGAHNIRMSVIVSDPNFSVSKTYIIPLQWSNAATWRTILPISDTGHYSNNDFAIDTYSNGNYTYFRLRRIGGGHSGTARIRIESTGSTLDSYTSTAGTGSTTAPTSNYSNITQNLTTGNVGINVAAPAYKLQVEGDAFISTRLGIGSSNSKYSLNVGTSDVRFNNSLSVGSSVGIGTTAPLSMLQVGSRITWDKNYAYDTNAIVVSHPTPTSDSLFHDPKSLLILTREGTQGEAYGAGAAFNISRYEDLNYNSRTRFDIALAHDEFDLATNTALTLLSSGKLGLGTTFPKHKLEVIGDALISTRLGIGSTDIKYSLNVGNTSAFNNIHTTGYVGIGTTAPRTKLQVGNKASDDANYAYDANSFFINHPTATSATVLNDPKTLLTLTREGTYGQAYAAGAAFNLSRYENNSVNSRTRLDINLSHDTFSLSTNTAMTLLSSGNLGLGTTIPQYKLDIVNGDINITSGTIRIAGSTGPAGHILSSTGIGLSWIAAPTGTGTTYSFINGLSNNIGTTNFVGLGGTLTKNTQIGTSSFNIAFLGLGNSLGLAQDNNGYVGIGTSSPTSKLHVIGDASISTNLTVGATFISVGSTNLVTNLNANYLNGFNSDYFTNIGQTGSLPYVNNATDTTLTRSGVGPYTLGLNLGSTNAWSALQTFGLGIGVTGNSTFSNNLTINGSGLFGAGIGITGDSTFTNNLTINGSALFAASIGVTGNSTFTNNLTVNGFGLFTSGIGITGNSVFTNNLTVNGSGLFTSGIAVTGDSTFTNNLTIGGTFVSVGSTNLVTNLNADYLDGFDSTDFIYTASNGITKTGNDFQLGGSLTANTAIGTSSFSLSFAGLGDTQSLFIASSGFVGIGTTDPQTTLQVHKNSGYTHLRISTDTDVGAGNDTSLVFASDQDGTPTYASIGQFGDSALRLSSIGNLVIPSMLIDTNENVSIGVTGTLTNKLSVNGNVSANLYVSNPSDANKIFLNLSNTSYNSSSLSLSQSGSIKFNSYWETTGTPGWRYATNQYAATKIENTQTGLAFAISTLGVESSATSPITWNDNQIFLANNGYVGIGTSASSRKLHVSEDSNSVSGIQVSNNNSNTQAYANINIGASGSSLSLSAYNSAYANAAFAGKSLISSPNTLRLATSGPLSTPTIEFGHSYITTETYMTLKSGKLGIGTTEPEYPLEVLSYTNDQNSSFAISKATSTLNRGIGMLLRGYNASNSWINYGGVNAEIVDNTDGSEDGRLNLRAMVGGTIAHVLTVGGGNFVTGSFVGINTTTPVINLDVAASTTYNTGMGINLTQKGTGSARISFLTGGAAQYSMGVVGSGGGANAGKFMLGTSTIESNVRLTIDTNGDVGIGTSDPSQALDVVRDQNAGTVLRVANSNVGNSAYSALWTLVDSGANYGGSIAAYSSAYAQYPTFQNALVLGSNLGTTGGVIINAAGATAPIRFLAGGRAITDEAMRILPSGYVGIGDTNPYRQLSVGQLDGIAQFGSYYGALVSGDNYGHSVFGTNLYVDSNNALKTNASHATYGYAAMDAGWGSIKFYATDGATTANATVTPSAKMIIDATGGISIPTDDILLGNGFFDANWDGNLTKFASMGSSYYNGTNYITNPNASLGSNNVSLISSEPSKGVVFYTQAATGNTTRTDSLATFNTYERMRMDLDGDLGIGNTNPAYKLSIGVGTSSFNVNSRGEAGIGSAPASNFRLYILGQGATNSSTTYSIVTRGIDGVANNFWIRDDGVGYNRSGLWNGSDRRLKENINYLTDSESANNIINALKPATYNYIGSNLTNTPGFIAQDVQEILPNIISPLDTGYLSLKVEGITPYLVLASQNHDTKINNLLSDLAIDTTGQIEINYQISSEVLASLGHNATKNHLLTAQYTIRNQAGQLVTRIGQFAEIASAKITAGLVTAKAIVTDRLVADKVSTKEIETVKLTPDTEITDTITVEGNLAVNDLTAKTATVSTLYADNVISKQGNITEFMSDKISALRAEVQDLVANSIATQSTPTSPLVAEASTWSTQVASDSGILAGSALTLTGDAIIGARLTVNGTFNAGQIAIKDNLIETTATALYIQPSNTGSVHIMGDSLVIAANGEIVVNGNLAVSGKLTASNVRVTGDLFANLLTADNATISGTLTAADLKSDRLTTDKLLIATDSATSLIIADSATTSVSTSSAQLTSNATAGTVTLPAGKTELVINTSKLSANSMVYLTPVGSTKNQVVYVKDKVINDAPRFTIAIDQPLDAEVQINWWIIN